MNLKYVKAKKDDAELLINIYNASFYDDFIRYGKCPAYGRTKAKMEESISKFSKMIIYAENVPVGAISVENKGNGEYYLGCLCIVPEFQGKGIGSEAVKFAMNYYDDWSRFTLITPIDKEENVAFYTEKCGFEILDTEMDGNVKVVRFVLER